MSPTPRRLAPDDPTYPERLCALSAPPILAIDGDLGTAARVVAVVGTRTPSPEAEGFAFALAGALTRAGAVVVSGGAVGVDAAAHRGALAAGGRTWAVAPTGRSHCFPKEHDDLYRQIARGPGAMLWPFADDVPPMLGNFPRRNGVLVALSDAVVLIQAGAPSGSLNAARWARKLGREVWAVPGPPWDPRFTGCRAAIDAGARVLTSSNGLLAALGLAPQKEKTDRTQLGLTLGDAAAPPSPPSPPIDDAAGQALWAACSAQPRHIDEIAENARLCVTTALTRLLTLALENVLVEGPEGFYRRAK
ncbi:MAG: DNA-processing protein DprA [Polyangiaceae bacterium]